MKIISIAFFIGSLVQIALSASLSTVTNRELMTMNADELFEFYVTNFVHDVDHKAPEVVEICQRYLTKIDSTVTMLASEDAKPLENLHQAIEDYINVIQDHSKTCGLYAITRSVPSNMVKVVNRDNAMVNRLWKGLIAEIEIAVRMDLSDFDFIVQKIQVVLRSDKTLQEQLLKKANEVKNKCEAIGELESYAWNALYNAIGY